MSIAAIALAINAGAQNVVSVPLPAVITPPSADATNNPGQIQVSIRPQLTPVTPEEADRQMRSRLIPADLNRGFEHLDTTRTRISAMSATAPLASMSSIPELARALKNNPDLIYEFVHDKIEFYPIWGVQKGAFGALLDRQGTAFDQAALMVALLRQAGYPASYILGKIKPTIADLRGWLGLGASATPCVVRQMLVNGGIPFDPVTCATMTSTSTISMSHVWVKASIGGSNYHFDPSFKTHTLTSGIDLTVASGYNAATYLADAKVSPYLAGSNFVQNVNRAKVRSNLAAYANNLASYLRTNKPAATLEDVIGGAVIVPTGSVAPRNAGLPNVALVEAEWTAATGDIPAGYKPWLTITYKGVVIGKAASDLIYGHRLTLVYNASNQPVLTANGVAVSVGPVTTIGAYDAVEFAVTHPYAAAAASITQPVKAGGTYFIVNGWGPVGRGLVEYQRARLDEAKAAGSADTSESVIGSTLGVLAATWMAQTGQSADITGRLAKSKVHHHRLIGIAGYNLKAGSTTDGFSYVDLPGQVVQFTSEEANSAKESAAFVSEQTRASVFESSAVRQMTGVDAVSTVRLIDIAVGLGNKIFDVTSSNWSAISGQMLGCSSSQLSSLATSASMGRLTLPGNCAIQQELWKGMGFFIVQGPASSPTALGSVIDGGFAGGYATTTQPAVTTVATSLKASSSSALLEQSSGKTLNDPIDMVNGGFLYAHNDISTGIGEFPHSLSFQRLYSSGLRTTMGPLGNGWTHNLAVTASANSDGFQGQGEDSALDAVPALVEQMVAYDLHSDAARPLDKMVVATLGQAWLGDQLVNNTVVVRQGLNGEVFTKLPDGSYNPPPGNSAKLTLSGGLYTYETVHKAKLNFNSAGQISSYVLPSGVQAQFSYSGNDLVQVKNSFGRTLAITSSGGRISKVTAGTRSVNYIPDATNKNLDTFTDTLGKATKFQYDQSRITTVRYPSNPTVDFLRNTYDTLGRVQTQTNAAGKTYTYYFSGTRTEEVDPLGGSKVSYLDDRGQIVKAIDPVQRVTLNSYDGHSRLVKSVLPEGNRVEYDYDDATCNSADKRCTHNIKTVRQVPKAGSPLATLSSGFVYESAFNNVYTVTDPKSQVTSYTYTAQGLANTVTAPADEYGVQPVTTIGYTSYTPSGVPGFPAFYLQTSVTNKTSSTNSVVNTTSYDPASYYAPRTTVVDVGTGKLNLTNTLTFDADGNLKQVDGPRTDVSDIISFDYDSERRPIKTVNAISEQTIMAYDDDGRLVRSANSLEPLLPGYWVVSCRSYFPSGKPKQAWGPSVTIASTSCPDALAPTPVVDFAYDDLDRPKSVTQNLTPAEGGNRVSETQYWGDDRVKTVRRAVGTGLAQDYASYTYTANGLPQTIKDARNNLTTYEYDGHDRKAKTRFPDKSTAGMSSTTDVEQYGYDNNGNLTSVIKRGGQTITLGYDKLNRLLTRTYPSAAENVTFHYDLVGRRTAANKSDHNIGYVWDNAGRLKNATAGTRTLSYDYDAGGNRTRITWPDTAFVTTSYDALNRPVDLKEWGVNLLASYAYFPGSLRQSITRGNGTTTSYSYSPQGLDLGSITHELAGTAADVQFAYNRNQAREITKSSWNNTDYDTWRPTVAGTKTYTPNGLNQYGSITGASPSYADGNGNLTGDGTWTYGFDASNQLVSANKSGYSASLVYDAEGRMRQTTLASVKTDLLYDGADLVAEFDAAGTLTKRYVHGAGVDEPLVVYDSAAVKSWLYTDHLGSVIAQADTAGNRTATYKYGPFGETDNAGGVRFRYTGQQYLGGLDLYHYKARFYSPAMGRFLQTDPIGVVDDLNLYGYVGNDSINQTDPTGNCPWCVGAGTSVLMGGAIRYVTSGGDWSSVFDAKSIAIDAALGAAGTGLVSKATNLVSVARAGVTNIERNVARGALGESMIGIGSTGKQAINVGGAKFVPDRLTATALDEVKNVAKISAKDARQIAGEATYAAQNSLEMTLHVRQGANLSRVQGLIDAGALTVETIPGVARNGFRMLKSGESALVGAGLGAGASLVGGK